MESCMKIYCVAVTFGFAALLGFHGLEERVGRPIGDRAAQDIVGGGCNSWTSGSVACNSTGEVLCSGSAVKCNSVTFSSMVTNGAGQSVEDTGADKTCFPCSSTSASCGSTHVTNTIKNGNCGT